MKKEDITSFIVYAIILVAIGCGAAFYANEMIQNGLPSGTDKQFLPVVIIICCVIGTFLIGQLLIELGHAVGAKVGKYDVVSFDVFGLRWSKIDGKWKFKFSLTTGLFGDTQVRPRYDENGNCISKPKAMLWFGNIFLGIVIIIFGSLCFTNKGLLHGISFMIALTAGCLLFFNSIPMKLDSEADGYKLKIVSKPGNVDAFNELLKVKSCAITGEEPGETKVFEEVSDYTGQINMVMFYNLLEKGDYRGALKIIELNLTGGDNISEKFRISLVANKLYILLISKEFEKAKKYYEEDMAQDDKRYLSNSNEFECLRTYVLVSTYLDPSESEVQYVTSRADKAYKRVLPLRKDIELKLYKDAIKAVREAHPKWEPIISDKAE